MRSRLLAVVSYLRSRPLLVFLAGSALSMALLVPFHFIDVQQQFIGVPAAVVSLLVVSAAIVGGPRVGIGLALVAGGTYDTLVITDRWLLSGLTTGAVLLVWVAAGVLVGMLGDRYRGQVARALEQATTARDALDSVLGATPSFHSRGSTPSVARAICDAARQTFACDAAVLFAVEGESLRPLARSPRDRGTPDPQIQASSSELATEFTENALPRFVADIRAPGSPALPAALADDPRQVAMIGAPVMLEETAVALLALSWARPVSAPDRARLGVVQRFAEHAAVALGQAQRTDARREAAGLYRRFQASLVPAIASPLSGVSASVLYRPGERRMLLGGDFVDAVVKPDGNVAVVIGDVTGHGPDAAALGASLRAVWRAAMLRGASLGDSLRTLNSLTLDEGRRVETDSLGLAMLATVCAAEFEPGTGQAQFVVAGHPPPLILGRGAHALSHGPGPMLGLYEEQWWPVTREDLPARWGVLLYTDGLIEARTEPGADTRLGIDGLAGRMAGLWKQRSVSKAALDALVDEVEAGQRGRLPDDVTLLLLSGRSRDEAPSSP